MFKMIENSRFNHLINIIILSFTYGLKCRLSFLDLDMSYIENYMHVLQFFQPSIFNLIIFLHVFDVILLHILFANVLFKDEQ
jgi:hypothetical protein